jgi:TRAP-type mannitol/chloroaromatic compound transport system permease large subunit
MLQAGYNIKVSAGAITAGGCLGILIPPSVLLIVYGATAGVSVVQLYAGAFFPGFMLAFLYIGYIDCPRQVAPAADAAAQRGRAPRRTARVFESARCRRQQCAAGLFRAAGGGARVPARTALGQLFVRCCPRSHSARSSP